MQFAKRMQQKQEEQGEEFAKSVKVNLTKKVVACQLDRLDAMHQLEVEKGQWDCNWKLGDSGKQEMLQMEQEMLELEQVLEVCVGNVA